MPAPIENREQLSSVRAKINALIAENEPFDSRAELVAWVAAGNVPVNGREYRAGGLSFIGSTGATDVPGLPGLVPNGVATPSHYGAVGDGTTDDRPAFAAMNAAGRTVYIPKPPTRWNVSTAIDLNNVAVTVDPKAVWVNLTDGGLITWTNDMGGWTNVGVTNTRQTNINRFADRAFFGAAADQWAGDSASADGGSGWWSNSANGAAYLGVNAQNLTIGKHNPYGVVSLVRGSDVNDGNPIGFGGSVVNDVAGKNAWGAILELQHESGAGLTLGLEIGAKHKGGAFTTINAYNTGSGVVGFWFAGGGDANFGGAATLPANSPYVILKNGTSGLSGGGWATGPVIKADAIDGVTGASGETSVANGYTFGRGHAISWGAPVVGALPVGSFGARVYSHVNDAANAVQAVFTDSTLSLLDRSGNTFASFIDGGNDYLAFRSTSAGGRLDALGAATNIDIRAVPKGSGRFNVDTGNVNIASGVLQVAGVQLVASRKTGWSEPTGTVSRAAFDTSTATLGDVAQRLAALILDLRAGSGGHGLIGA